MIRPRRTHKNWPPPDAIDWENSSNFAAFILAGGTALAIITVALQILCGGAA